MLAGATTFLTMAYIIVVQPAVLSGSMFGMKTGMDFGAVTAATCLSAALCVPGNHDIKLMRKLKGSEVQIKHGLAGSLDQLLFARLRGTSSQTNLDRLIG